MKHILTQRGIDFDAYSPYLASIRDRLPAHVAVFASDPRHYSLDDRESLHDAWLESVVVTEPASGARHEERRCELELRLLGAFHDRVHVLRYSAVRHYELLTDDVTRGHGDLITHEVRLASDDQSVVHEILFTGAPGMGQSRIVIECAEFAHSMISHR